MYLSIIILPLLASIASGFFGRKIGVTGSHIITCCSVIITTLLAIIAFFEVGLNGIPVTIKLFRWIDSESLNVLWAFNFDSLTVSMLIPVLIVSSLVHVYSIGYMSHDPHNQRFFSYLSLFTFMMIILVTSNNYLSMFVGWEGKQLCLKWLIYIITYYLIVTVSFTVINKSLFFTTDDNPKLRSDLRIGAHDQDVISILIGSILGDSHLERRKGGIGTRIIFEQCNMNVEYIMWFHNFFASRGYMSNIKPKLTTRIKKDNKVFYQYRVSSYTFTSFNWLHDLFYKDINGQLVKVVSTDLYKYLTPLSLAVWFMDDGSKTHNTVRIATNCFTYDECLLLCKIIKDKYNIILTVQKSGKNKGYIIYVETSSYSEFEKIIKPYMLPSMLYKLSNREK